MPVPAQLIEGVAAAHTRLHATLAGIDDATARQPSRLPGWTVGHVLTHLARNADSIVRRLEAAADGRMVEQYAGGAARRTAEIEAGAHRPAAELAADLRRADAAVERAFDTIPDQVWDRPVLRFGGQDGPHGNRVPASELPFSRWREVEVHHVDLGLACTPAYTPADWPADLVERMLPDLLARLPERADRAALAAWALDRGPAPTLRSWGS